MNKLAQMEFNPGALLMSILGAVLAFVMAGRMEASIGMKIVTVLVTGVSCYFIASIITNK